MNLELKRFDMKTISFKPDESKGPVVVLIGRRDTGKSFLVKDLLYYQQSIPIGTVISGTEELYLLWSITIFILGSSVNKSLIDATTLILKKY